MKSKQYVSFLFLSVIAGFLGGTLGVWFLMPPSVLAQGEPQGVISPDRIPALITTMQFRAEEFRVIDTFSQGNMRAVLNSDFDGNPRVRFYDNKGNLRASLYLDSDGNPRLSFYDNKGNLRVALGPTELKHPDTGSTEIRAPSSLVLFDEDGKVVWSAP